MHDVVVPHCLALFPLSLFVIKYSIFRIARVMSDVFFGKWLTTTTTSLCGDSLSPRNRLWKLCLLFLIFNFYFLIFPLVQLSSMEKNNTPILGIRHKSFVSGMLLLLLLLLLYICCTYYTTILRFFFQLVDFFTHRWQYLDYYINNNNILEKQTYKKKKNC